MTSTSRAFKVCAVLFLVTATIASAMPSTTDGDAPLASAQLALRTDWLMDVPPPIVLIVGGILLVALGAQRRVRELLDRS